jgi:tRNA(fMet)-specific endonuclease VapC
MEAVLLDTDVFSFLIRPGDTRGDLYRPLVTGKTVALSFISVAELYVWTVTHKWGAQKLADFEERLGVCVIVPYDLELCKTYARVRSGLAPGVVIPTNDLWIAVCAIRHEIPLLTHNRRHFERVPGLKFLEQQPAPPAPPTGNLFEKG